MPWGVRCELESGTGVTEFFRAKFQKMLKSRRFFKRNKFGLLVGFGIFQKFDDYLHHVYYSNFLGIFWCSEVESYFDKINMIIKIFMKKIKIYLKMSTE